MDKKVDFEKMFQDLEGTVKNIEEVNLPLADSLELIERGISLSRTLRAELDAVENRVEMLMKNADGEGEATTPFLLQEEK